MGERARGAAVAFAREGVACRVSGSSRRELLERLEAVLAPARPAAEHLGPELGLSGCLVCGHPELYTQRDFPRALGVGIVVVAALLAPATRYASLLVAALVDAVLYRVAPRVVVCYVCRAEHRGFASEPRHPAFDREIAERVRYGERAVMGKPMRPGGTAGAPEPEH